VRATRRTAAIAPAAAALALTGCTPDSSTSSSNAPSPTPSAATGAAAPDPDREALDRALTLSEGLLEQARRRPRVDPGGRFAALHTAHLAALARAAGPSPSPSTSARGIPALPGPRALRAQEAAAQRELAHLAQEAASGALARLLASMSAGIAAHLAAAGPVR
jgi:hypothetical protein